MTGEKPKSKLLAWLDKTVDSADNILEKVHSATDKATDIIKVASEKWEKPQATKYETQQNGSNALAVAGVVLIIYLLTNRKK